VCDFFAVGLHKICEKPGVIFIGLLMKFRNNQRQAFLCSVVIKIMSRRDVIGYR
jgi:hypothetical protein